MTIGGTTSNTNAGTYSASFTPNSNYRWSDGTTTAKNVSWTINKATGSLSLSATSVSLDSSTTSTTVTVTRAGTGTITATSNATGVATVSVSGTTLTITGQSTGTATITVAVAASTNYTAPADKTISVSVQFLPAKQVLNNTSWADIKTVTDAGQAANYWAVGDRKAVTLNGTCSKLTFSNQTYYVYILGFDHNSSYEGANRIHFQFGYTALSGGTHIAFISGYDDDSDFYMNSTDTNSGGWKDSFMRNTVCPAFKACLPSDLNGVVKSTTKYSDNTGGGSNTASYVTATTDDIFLLSEFEVFGTRSYANSAEQNYQAQYQYYKNGNSKVRYRHDSTGSSTHWWLRSVYASTTDDFCYVNNFGSANNSYASFSFGVAPAFCV